MSSGLIQNLQEASLLLPEVVLHTGRKDTHPTVTRAPAPDASGVCAAHLIFRLCRAYAESPAAAPRCKVADRFRQEDHLRRLPPGLKGQDANDIFVMQTRFGIEVDGDRGRFRFFLC